MKSPASHSPFIHILFTIACGIVAFECSASEEVGHPLFLSPHFNPIVIHQNQVYVTNTPGDTLDVLDPETMTVRKRIPVGIDPVSLAIRPDGKELWIANHVSDSISVIDLDPGSSSYQHIIATIQELDPVSKSTLFDEPVGIAFADSTKAYVALSSENQIAVIDVSSRKVIHHLDIPAQDPRAIVTRNGKLYVVPFESNNQTQLSGGGSEFDWNLVTFNAWEHSIFHNNVLSLGHVVDIVKHPAVPDRDLFIFDTQTDELIRVVDTLGTLLYGLTVDSVGNVFIAQTDARNDINGRSGTRKHGLKQMQNRAFLNRITRISSNPDSLESPNFFDLEPLPPEHPQPGQALATPYAIQISDDDQTLVMTASGSDQLVTLNPATGQILGRVQVDHTPEGLTLEHDCEGNLIRAWTLNASANSISVVDLQDRSQPRVTHTIPLDDPTPPEIKKGRIAFESAAASSTGTFSCASCHPNGHTDQLLWVLKTPVVTGGNQIMPRLTMPIRGIRDTEPYHWDGIPGDPYGGIHSASIYWEAEPNSELGDPVSPALNLVNGSLATTMKAQNDSTVNNQGKAGRLSSEDRVALAKFILEVPYPPAPKRAYDNVLTQRARDGFELFHIKGNLEREKPKPNVCGDCHRMPFWVSTNTPGTGMDAPTWRGAYDRWMILPQGRLNIIAFDFYKKLTEKGVPERDLWRLSWRGHERFDPVWDMALEGSTGFHGSFSRQLTFNNHTISDPEFLDLLSVLEGAAKEEAIILRGHGIALNVTEPQSLNLVYKEGSDGWVYQDLTEQTSIFTHQEMLDSIQTGNLIITLTAHIGSSIGFDTPQPAIWASGPIQQQRGRQEFPTISQNRPWFRASARHVREGAALFVNGRRAPGDVLVDDDSVEIHFDQIPKPGTHMFQLQNPDGLMSNDFIFHVQ